ncbi:CBM1 domain-containing protein [Mycena chlorophos]|uniref:CBM1 domain-containing protein n=1 Tax=Mycena chlorophos TaxID=658473 RepID=A0A8H6TKN1_MYCCL|nr:CBM1 domain-containing protein [Mycena chlorophos]
MFSSLLTLLPTTTLLLAASAPAVRAQVGAYGQCAGYEYFGETTCVSGYYCSYESDYFSQCVPGTAPPAYSGPVNYWFPFGDSYTTTSFNATYLLPNIHNPIGNPPFPGYTGGGGENYVGYLTEVDNTSVTFAYNYAYGGATINASLVAPYLPTVLSLIDQVNEFFGPVEDGGYASKPASTPWTSENALFSVWIGINDLAGSYYESGNRSAFAEVLLGEYFSLMQELIAAEGPAAQQALQVVLEDFNSRLATHVASFKAANSGVKTWIWDAYTVFTNILADPTAYGFVDATSYGNTGDFWANNFHPGPAAHAIFAKDIATLMAGSLWF